MAARSPKMASTSPELASRWAPRSPKMSPRCFKMVPKRLRAGGLAGTREAFRFNIDMPPDK